MSITQEEQDVIAKLFPPTGTEDGENTTGEDDGDTGEKTPESVTGDDLMSRLDDIEDEDLAAESEVRAKLKHLLEEEAATLFTLESLKDKVDVMAKSQAVGISEKEYAALEGAFKACTPEEGGADIEKAVLKEYIVKELKDVFTDLTISAWSEVLAPPPPKLEPTPAPSGGNGEEQTDGAQSEKGEDDGSDEAPVITTITLTALLDSCGDHVSSFKTKMAIEEVAIVKAVVQQCSEEGPDFLASAFQEALMESKDKVSAEVVKSWTEILAPLVSGGDSEEDEGGLKTNGAAFKAKRAAQNWSAATGLAQNEMGVILEAFETLNPDEWYQGGSVGKNELLAHAVAIKLPVCTCSSWTDILKTEADDEALPEDSPIQFDEFLQERKKMVHVAQFRLLKDEVSLVMSAFSDISPRALDCNTKFPARTIKAKLDTSSLTGSKQASYESLFGMGLDLEYSYFECLAFRADEQIAYDTGMTAGEACVLRTAFIALDNERNEFLKGKVKSADLYALLVERGKAFGAVEKLAWSTYLNAANSSNEDVDFNLFVSERGLQTEEAKFQISKDEIKRVREQFTYLDEQDTGKVVFTELLDKLKEEYALLGEDMGELWSQLRNHVTQDKDGKVSLVDFLMGRTEIALMNQGNLTSAEILDMKSQYENDDTQLEWKDYLLTRAPLVVEKRERKTIPQGEDAKRFLMKSKAGERDGEVVTLPDLLIQGCTELCRHKPQGLDAVTWLGQWLLENNPNQPNVIVPNC